MDVASNLLLAYSTYVIGTASPGPANLAIIRSSLSNGRTGGMATALGVITGSVMWGLVSALGLGALLASWPQLLQILSLLGGCYLTWLAWRALNSALSGKKPEINQNGQVPSIQDRRKLYLAGLALHLTNPKAMFVWMSIIALGLPPGTTGPLPFIIVAGCAVLGAIIFFAYALVFSIPTIMRGYLQAFRFTNGVIAALFAFAGLSLIYRSTIILLSPDIF